MYVEVPAINPPPPQQHKYKSGFSPKLINSSTISLPLVPWPAIMFSSSYGLIKIRFSILAISSPIFSLFSEEGS